jgi:hypothetical protein
MKELTAAVIETVVLLNSKMMKTFKRNRAMIQAGVYAVPKDIWQWAESTGNSELTRFDVAAASLAMLPTAIASVTAKGIKFQGLYFAGPDLHDERFAIARQNGVSKVQISYDPLCADRIFVHSAKTSNRGPGAGYEVFTQVGTTYAGLSFEDIKMHLVSEAQAQKLNQFKQAELVARHFAATKDLSSSAKKKRSRKLSHSEVAKGASNAKVALKKERMMRPSPASGGETPHSSALVIDASNRFERRPPSIGDKLPGDGSMGRWLAEGKDKPDEFA